MTMTDLDSRAGERRRPGASCPPEHPVTPASATYRLQLHAGFTFADAIAALPTIAALGVTHLYLSPVQEAMAGSTHHYDGLLPPRVSPVLGGYDGLRELRGAAAELSLGIVLDIVPNHAGVADARQNAWWWDALRRGPDSPHRRTFDFVPDADGRIALPALASDGDLSPLRIVAGDDGDELAYYDHHFPIAPGTATDDPIATHAAQHYRLVPWDAGLIGYRRFFAVNELAAVRQEDPEVFDATHAWLAGLAAENLFDGLRVDHPDGLADPAGYLRRLRDLIGPGRWLIVEKILTGPETLDPSLPVDGTTGYEALRLFDGVFLDPAGAEPLADLHLRRVGDRGDAAWLHEAEPREARAVLHGLFPAELRRLAGALGVETTGAGDALVELVAALPCYRADYRPLAGTITRVLGDIATARPDLATGCEDVAARIAASPQAWPLLAQVRGAVAAKSVEDRLFYRTARLTSLNEVGGDPGLVGVSTGAFHLANAERAAGWPLTMTTRSTHDTKRSEDVRARIGVLAQVPDEWAALVDALEDVCPSPDPAAGLLLWQTLFGVWPSSGDEGGAVVTPALLGRLHDYARKALREAEARTSWSAPDADFEAAVDAWLDAATSGPAAELLSAFAERTRELARAAMLGAKVLQLLSPGVPDVYQGTQWPDDSLVDPDNRRPVDYARATNGEKHRLTCAALQARRRPGFGGYTPLAASGPDAGRLLGVGRGSAAAVVTIRGAGGWDEATTIDLPDGVWLDPLSDRRYEKQAPAAQLLADAPAVVLHRV